MAASGKSGRRGSDRLSSLDDSLLHHILGFLDTKEAVQTSVLSKRWTHLWTCLSTLSFNESTFRKINRYHQMDDDSFENFENFVTQVLIRRDNCQLVKLCYFAAHRLPNPSLIESLLDYALKNGVQDIYLNLSCVTGFDSFDPIEWPRRFVNCQSLHKLNLVGSMCSYVRLPRDLVLTALKSLCMNAQHFSKDRDDGSFFPSCPNLEDLCFFNVNFFDKLKIVAPSLRTLEFRFLDLPPPEKNMVKIIAPRLTTFRYTGSWPMTFSVSASSLEDVDICLFPYVKDYELEDDLILDSIEMMNKFRITKSLTMNVRALQVEDIQLVLSANPDLLDDGHLSKFRNLKRLTVKKVDNLEDLETFRFPLCLTKYFLNDFTELKFI